MSRNRDYPEYQYEHANITGETDKVCVACDKKAAKLIRVAWSYMRGDDGHEPVCKRHFKMAENNWSQFRAHMFTKEKFLKQKTEAS